MVTGPGHISLLPVSKALETRLHLYHSHDCSISKGDQYQYSIGLSVFVGSIEERMVTLQRRWEKLIQSNAERKQRLLDSLQLQVTDTADLGRHL